MAVPHNILFIHPNFPGQFKHIIPALQNRDDFNIAYICRERNIKHGEGINIQQYQFDKRSHKGTHRYLQYTHEAIREAREVCICANKLISQGFIPDIVVGHTAWGGLLFIKDLFPNAKVIGYCELYFSENFDQSSNDDEKASNDSKAFLRCRNLHTLMQMESMDVGISPTNYQLQSHPAIFHQKMHAIHEGVDTELCRPDPDANFPVPNTDLVLGTEDTVVTYVSRGFEPARGFFQYMEALERLCKELPKAHFLLVGGDNTFYSAKPKDKCYREQALERYDIDNERVHFTGRLTHEGFRKVVQISSAHIYLSRPLFLSWSIVEAMSMGAPIVASKGEMVEEILHHSENAILVDYHNPEQISEAAVKLVKNAELAKELGQNARKKIVDHYDTCHTVALWIDVIEQMIDSSKT